MPPRDRPLARVPTRNPPRPGRPASASELRPEAPPKLFRVAGLPAVTALFAHEPKRVERLFFEQRFLDEAAPFCKMLAAARRPYRMVDAEELAKVAGTVLHGGIVALIPPRTLPAFDPEAAKGWREPLLILDGVGNPHNLGAILRTAAFFGLPRVVLSDHPGQALPSEAAYRVAEGGFEWVSLYKAAGLPTALRRLRDSHRVVATALAPDRPTIGVAELRSKDRRPIALVLGNEENGLPPATLAACETVLTIPGSGRVQSLNVAATAAILVQAMMG